MAGVLASALFFFAHAGKAATKIDTVRLTGKNTVILYQEMTTVSSDTFIAAVIGKRVFLAEEDTLYILIVSPGGYYAIAQRQREFLRHIPNVSLICKYCASAAGYVFATAKVPRLVIPKSVLMMHEMRIDGVTANMMRTTDNVAGMIESSDEFNKEMYTILQISKDEYNKKIIGKEWNVKGVEIIKLHLADKLVKIECDNYIKILAPDTCSE